MTKSADKMKKIKVISGTKVAKDVESIYIDSFPEEELIPFEDLLEMSNNDSVSFTAYYCDNSIIAFSYSVDRPEFVFILYFAVNPKYRGKGYGTKILTEYLLNSSHGKPVYLNAESPDSSVADNEKRIRRINFYERAGIHQSGYEISDGYVTFCVMSTSVISDITPYIDFVNEILSKYPPESVPVSEVDQYQYSESKKSE